MPIVLVVDDSALDRRLAGGLLEQYPGFNVTYAADGSEALEQVRAQRPDVVLTDLMMPNMNGWELVTALRKDHPQVPAILMTARGNEEIAVQALRQGAASYVPKRRLVQDLYETVEQVLSATREDRTHSRLMQRMVEHDSAFELENDLTLISSLVEHLQQGVSAMRVFEPSDRVRVGVAIQEALVNAYFHGNLEIGSDLREVDHKAYYELARERSAALPYRDRRIFVRFRLTRTEVAYTVRDEGPGFDPAQRAAPENGPFDRVAGRGLILMQTFMDEVRYNALGNEVTLIKRRTGVHGGHPMENPP